MTGGGGRGEIKHTDAERRRLEANWVSCPLRSDSSTDDFFPVTMPAHAPKQKCDLSNHGLHTQAQIKWTNHEDKSQVLHLQHNLIGSTIKGNTYKTRSFI